jgi:hypothetical protein
VKQPGASIYEQGAGNLNLYPAFEVLNAKGPRVSIWPKMSFINVSSTPPLINVFLKGFH